METHPTPGAEPEVNGEIQTTVDDTADQTADQTIDQTTDQPSREFNPGAQVVYGLHGRCSVTAVQTREINGDHIRFYRLEPVRPPLARARRQEPAIWLPVTSARRKGLRPMLVKEELDEIWEILESREYYFALQKPWHEMVSVLEKTIQQEGATGLAKVVGFCSVLHKRYVVAPADITRFFETTRKLLAREIAEVSGESIRVTEELMEKKLRNKAVPDN